MGAAVALATKRHPQAPRGRLPSPIATAHRPVWDSPELIAALGERAAQ